MTGTTFAAAGDFFFRPALRDVFEFELGRSAEDVRREFGLERVVRLASNEGPFAPFPAAIEALARGASELNRYPDGSCTRLREALAGRHDVGIENVIVGAGVDALVGQLSAAALDPGDEVVCPWPSYPAYVLSALKQGAIVRRVPLTDERCDLDAILGAISATTKLVYVCNPNNPTGTMVDRSELDAYFERVPEHVLTVLDEAYCDYVEEPTYPDGIEDYVRKGRRAIALRTFSKIYGLAGLRVGYGIAPPAVVSAIRKVQTSFDATQASQDAALASLGSEDELLRRRRVNTEGRVELAGTIQSLGFRMPERQVTNFLYVDVGSDVRPIFEQLLRQGVIVRPMTVFGAPTAMRITIGLPDENEFCVDALRRVVEGRPRAGARSSN